MPDIRNLAIADTWRGKTVDVELVTRAADGTETTNVRRGVVKSTRRVQNKTILEIVDVDRAALDTLVPFKTFTVADWPKLFVDHVNRPIPQGIGQMRKVSLAYIDNTAGAYKYAGPEVIGTVATLQTLYRDGRIVNSAEYTTSTATAGGTTVFTVTFVQEQKDFNGKLYELTGDFSCPGSRLVTNEIKRILELVGLTTIAASFTAGATWSTTENALIDCGYVAARKAGAIVEDLLQVARSQLYRDAASAWGITIDQARAAILTLDDATDECAVEEYVRPEIASSLVIEYRTRSSDKEEFTGRLVRTCNGSAGQNIFKNPYINDHETADRFLCYMQRRENARATASAAVHGVQLTPGDVIQIASVVSWNGTKSFAAPSVSRPADKNVLELLEYDASIYTYSAGTLPADATSGYQPDYSQTPPAAPTGLAVLLQGTSSDTDGKTVAYALVMATPPTVNWAKLMVQLTDTTTNEIYQAQLRSVTSMTISSVNSGTDRITASLPISTPVNTPISFTGSLPSPLVVGTQYYIKTNVGGGVFELSATPGGALIDLTTTTAGGGINYPAYGATISGLRPNRLHSIVTWAVNASNLDGATAAIANFTTANYTTAPAAPTGVAAAQVLSRTVTISWNVVTPNTSTSPAIKGYRVFATDGSGYVQIADVAASGFASASHQGVVHGTTYTYKVRSYDVNGNESVDSSTSAITPSAKFDDYFMVGQGISGTSIANSSINRGRSNTSTGSVSGTITNGDTLTMTSGQVFTFFPAIAGGSATGVYLLANATTGGNDVMTFRINNQSGASQSYEVLYRYLNA